jgi:hypothetical protein
VKTAIQRDLPGVQAELLQLADGLREQRVLAGVAGLSRGWEDQATRTALGVLGDLRELRDIPELVGFPELALARVPQLRADFGGPVAERACSERFR